MNRIGVGITDCARYGNYERWFLDAPQKVDVIRLSYRLNNLDDIGKCQGIVLSGGEDVDPRRYKRPDLVGRVEFTDINEKRDDFEMQVIRLALQLKLPILGICRGWAMCFCRWCTSGFAIGTLGMQLFNVYQGGTLIYDIPSVTKISGHAKVQGKCLSRARRDPSDRPRLFCSFVGIDQRHEILVGEKTLLNEITGCVKGAVNSSHHQCVEVLGTDLTVAARAEDPIIEAIQWKNAKENPFYLGVQVEKSSLLGQSDWSSFLFFSGIQNEWLIRRVHFHSTFVRLFSITSPIIKTYPRSIQTKDPTAEWAMRQKINRQQSPATHRSAMVRVVSPKNSMTFAGDRYGRWTLLLHIRTWTLYLFFTLPWEVIELRFQVVLHQNIFIR